MRVVSGLILGVVVAHGAKRPNIVVLLADDHSAETVPWRPTARLGGLNRAAGLTPRLQGLAEEGATIESYFVVLSLCTPARASLLTGLYPHAHGATHLKPVRQGKFAAIRHGLETYPEVLREAGYETALFGKWHMLQRPEGFETFAVFLNQGTYDNPILLTQETWTSGAPDSARRNVATGYSSDVVALLAVDWIGKRGDESPYLVEAHFKEAHEPWQYPHRYDECLGGVPIEVSGSWTVVARANRPRNDTCDRADDGDNSRRVSIPEPKTLTAPTTGGPLGGLARGQTLEAFASKYMSPDAKQACGRARWSHEAWHVTNLSSRRAAHAKLVSDYMKLLAALDDAVGRILDAIPSDQVDDTIVLYTSDHGYFLGEHNYYTKRLAYEESIRAPFILRYPRRVAPRAFAADALLAANVDVAPTLLDLAGCRPLKNAAHGRSIIASLLRDREPSRRRESLYYRYYDDSSEPALTALPRPSHLAVRTHTWKLILYDGLRCTAAFQNATTSERAARAVFEFYDLARDSSESRNVFAETDADIIASARRQLQAAMKDEAAEDEESARLTHGAHLPASCLAVDFGDDDAFVRCLRDAEPCPRLPSPLPAPNRRKRKFRGAIIRRAVQATTDGTDDVKKRSSTRPEIADSDSNSGGTTAKRASRRQTRNIVTTRQISAKKKINTKRRPCSSRNPVATNSTTSTAVSRYNSSAPYDLNEHTAFEPFMYLHMQKAAGNTINWVLRRVCPALGIPCETVEPNILLQKTPRLSRQRGAFVVGSVRNPFDWYVSLYAYGCARKGSLFATLRARELVPAGLGRVLDDASNTSNFQIWMRVLFHGAAAVAARHNRDYNELRVLRDARDLGIGLMTHRFASLHVENFANFSTSKRAKLRRGAINHDFFGAAGTRRRLPSHNACAMIRTESLETSLAAALGHYVAWKGLSATTEASVRANKATHATYRTYYDSATRALVEQGDGMLLDEFGYEF
ncbi:hypothetical protein CTAYLR_005277 [Chrysophaeum taylorii]|uniref:Sulfatase N-terminal domain-containing protein n=1 Tax=Chrysophaeum taylorii TaxID=2483200 RepID=A0AAD7XNA8_9STRA|nr:hypothetical protein CTAYLR_005277 [Chrysophaeum taylorii]